MTVPGRGAYCWPMPLFHHVNLGVLPGDVEAEERFVAQVLGYRSLAGDAERVPPGARWFEADDGSQVHLSTDPDHRAPALAHVAVTYEGGQLEMVEERLRSAGLEFKRFQRDGSPPVIFCCDPAGNRWELRGADVG